MTIQNTAHIEKVQLVFNELRNNGKVTVEVTMDEGTNNELATFDHESHLDPARWHRIIENGVAIPGWVQYKNTVKAVSDRKTFRTSRVFKYPTPMPPGCSWTNVDLFEDWGRHWHVGATEIDKEEAVLRRVLSGSKVSGFFMALKENAVREWRNWPDIGKVREVVSEHSDFKLREFPHTDKEGVSCWIAPRRPLKEVIPLDEVAEWYSKMGCTDDAQEVLDARDLYLPAVGKILTDGSNKNSSGLHSWAVKKLVFGFPLVY